MERVSVSRTVDASPGAVREAMADVEAFMESSGFDAVEREGDALRLGNRVGLVEIELELALLDDADAELAYEQRAGIFESMRTEYHVEGSPGETAGSGEQTSDDRGTAAADGGQSVDTTQRSEATTVTATTEFEAVDLAVIGNVLDTTVIERQRRKEIEAQFDWLEETVA